jgi:hypothetical protein
MTKASKNLAVCSLLLLTACGASKNQTPPGAITLGPGENATEVTSETHLNAKAVADFEKRYIKVRQILLSDEKKFSGAHLIKELDQMNTYAEPIKIKPVKKNDLHLLIGGDLATARKQKTGKYEIVISRDLELFGIAHALSFGIEILKVRVATDDYLAVHTGMNNFDQINEGFKALDSGAFREFASRHSDVAQFILKVLFFAQMRSHAASDKLIAEGLDYNFSENRNALGSEINRKYLLPLTSENVAMSDSDAQALLTRINGRNLTQAAEFLNFLAN